MIVTITGWYFQELPEITLTQLANRVREEQIHGVPLVDQLRKTVGTDARYSPGMIEITFGYGVARVECDAACDYYIPFYRGRGFGSLQQYAEGYCDGDSILVDQMEGVGWVHNGTFKITCHHNGDVSFHRCDPFRPGTGMNPGEGRLVVISKGIYRGQIFQVANDTEDRILLGDFGPQLTVTPY